MNLNYIQLLVGMVLAFIAVTPTARAADVPYVSGGTGVDERQALLAKERDFNLKIVVAETSGDYLADVRVVIESAKKERVLETKMEGPILLAKLVPGAYTIRATSYKRAQTKPVTITAEGLRRVDFRWPPILDPEEEEE